MPNPDKEDAKVNVKAGSFKRALLSTLIIASLMVPLLLAPLKATAFSGSGSGTAGDPYIITTVEQLQEMKGNLTAHYALGNDIDASGTVNWNGGAGFEPIGTEATPFTGSFDGRRYKIINLFIDRLGILNVGLFGYVGSGGVVENVGMENVNISGNGGVGGLVGRCAGGTVSDSYSTGLVRGYTNTGGLIGYEPNGTLSNSYSTCSVNGGDMVGGLVGLNYYGTISNSYATGSVSGGFGWDNRVGGLVGANRGTVFNSYSTGKVNGSKSVGGLVGYKPEGTVSNSFWDIKTSGQTTSAGGTGKTTAQMKTKTTFTDAGWDFVNIWDIYSGFNSGYPFLAPPTVVPLSASAIFLIAVAVIGGLLGGIAVHSRYFGRRTRQRARRGRRSRRGRD
jgi:hypothetical protein